MNVITKNQKVIEGYFLDNNIYKPCYPTCKNGATFGDSNNNNCLECKLNYRFLNDFENDNNCYKNCDYYYYFDSNKNYYCTSEYKCPDEHNKLIKEKNKCIFNCSFDNKYIYEYDNKCYEECPSNTKKSLNNEFLCEKICNKSCLYINNINNECIEE